MRKNEATLELVQALKNAKDIELPMDPAYYDRLHSKIMGRVDSLPKPQPWYEKPRRLLTSPWKSWLLFR